jgi:hypothetical protein
MENHVLHGSARLETHFVEGVVGLAGIPMEPRTRERVSLFLGLFHESFGGGKTFMKRKFSQGVDRLTSPSNLPSPIGCAVIPD